MQKATFAAGCFWCVEAVFKRVKGVKEVRSGILEEMKKTPRIEKSLQAKPSTPKPSR
jgi:peptide methionine sulfoxide reductase MsrA